MNHNNPIKKENRLRGFAMLLLCLLVVGAIIYMKQSAADEKLISVPQAAEPVHQQIAVPDTSMVPGVIPTSTDTVVTSVLPDTVLGKDKRRPYEAGYEDGYATGCDDGAVNHEKATYDESNSFRGSHEQDEYVRGYREGYSKGYEDGKEGKQFNI